MSTLFILLPEAVTMASGDDKASILARLADVFAQVYELDRDLVLERVTERERLGSTGFGRHVAIPHARIPGLTRPVAAVIRLDRPVDFDAADGMPVDLVFGLLSPDGAGATHLQALAAISRMMRDERMHAALVAASGTDVIYSLLSNVIDRDAA
ncbi:PTS sugar transporter subunit IIA [Novosphingobium sp. 9U]|uniref:PTS sugar transporter subunit IIA n=1 Tax=Novosphingobium sp. 9U TaxID=2653158 RepID=UPI00135A3CC0|nr:PTS sugar transporter subunit IIA [Novosphingobium sp. 9U]